MDQGSLIQETNALLKQILDMHAQQKAESEKQKADLEKSMAEMKEKYKTDDSEDDWEKRIQETREKTKTRLEESKQRELQFKTELMDELRTQSDLLRQIAEKLER